MPRVQHAAAAAIVAVSCPPIKKDTAACHVSPIKTKSAYKERNWPHKLLALIKKLNSFNRFCSFTGFTSFTGVISLLFVSPFSHIGAISEGTTYAEKFCTTSAYRLLLAKLVMALDG